MDKSICRIGMLYGSSFFIYAQHHFYTEKEIGPIVISATPPIVLDFGDQL